MKDDIIKLVEYRLSQSEDTLSAAHELFKKGHYRDAINRAYYAMFYSSLGMLVSKNLGSSKHSGVISMFGQHFVKSGVFSEKSGRYLREAFELRQKCDYREFVEIESRQAKEIISHAEEFICEVQTVWKKIREE